MKDFKEYIITEASTTSFINKIKNEFKKEFGDTVQLASAKANFTQLYDIYIYSDDIKILKKVNEILKKHINIWKGFTDKELEDKLKEHEDFLNKHKDDPTVTPDRYPVEFFRFTSRDIRKVLGINKTNNYEL